MISSFSSAVTRTDKTPQELETIVDLFLEGLDSETRITLLTGLRGRIYRTTKSLGEVWTAKDISAAADVCLTKYRDRLIEQGYRDKFPNEEEVLEFLTRKPAVGDGY